MRALLVGGSGDGHGHVLARVERRGDAADGAALAGGVDALEDEDQRMLVEPLVARELRELPLEALDAAFVFPCGDLLREVEIANQLDVVDDGRRRWA